jgi:solute:Na+ symporter, SSS family
VNFPILLGLLAYLGLMLWIGQKAGRKIHSTSDYVLAGRRLPFWLTSTSLFATWFGAETCMGAAGASYGEGLLGVVEDPFGAALCLFILGLWVAKAMTGMNVLTLSDFLGRRFGPEMGVFSALCFIAAYLAWLGSQLVAFGFILSSVTGFPALPATLIGTCVILLYTYQGGLLADTVTDFIQAAVLIPGLFILLWAVVRHVGGWEALVAAVPADHWRLLPRDANVKDWIWYVNAWAVIGLGSLPSQDLFQRVSGGRTLREVRIACFVAGGLYLTVGMIPVLLGMAGRLLAPDIAEPEHILLELAKTRLPVLGTVVVLGALLSAIMSTADSIILAPATLFAQNILRPWFLKDQSDENVLRWCRRSTVFVTGIALSVAVLFKEIYALTLASSALLMATLLAPFLAGAYWPRAGRNAALASAAAGCTALAVGRWLWPDYPLAFVAMAASAAVLCVTAWVWPANRRPSSS